MTGDLTPCRPSRPEAVFLDRDGVINENRRDHVKSWSEFRFLPGAARAIGRLSRAGCRIFVVSNQAIINRGLVSRDDVDTVNSYMLRELEQVGGRIEGLAYCPHRPDQNCRCRKPRPGLLVKLAEEHAIDLENAVIIGDALSDIEAGQAVGCATILVLTGRGREQLERANAAGMDDFLVADDLNTAADLVLATPQVA